MDLSSEQIDIEYLKIMDELFNNNITELEKILDLDLKLFAKTYSFDLKKLKRIKKLFIASHFNTMEELNAFFKKQMELQYPDISKPLVEMKNVLEENHFSIYYQNRCRIVKTQIEIKNELLFETSEAATFYEMIHFILEQLSYYKVNHHFLKKDFAKYLKYLKSTIVQKSFLKNHLFKILDIDYFFYTHGLHFGESVIRGLFENKIIQYDLPTIINICGAISNCSIPEIQTILDRLLKEEMIVLKDNFYELKKESVYSFFQKNKQYDIIFQRINGITLEEIGKNNAVTRERVRQIEDKLLKQLNIQCLKEYQFFHYLNEYAFDKFTFCKTFNVDAIVFELFKHYITNAERKNPALLLEKNDLDFIQKNALFKALNRHCFIVEYDVIEKSKKAFVEYCVSKFASQQISIDVFYSKMMQFINEHQLNITFDNLRQLEGILTRCENVLQSIHKKLRFYLLDEIKIKAFLGNIDFNLYANKEISTQKIFDDYHYLMETYDILDIYELHNLIYRFQSLIEADIQCLRMPFIKFGKGNRIDQMLEIIIEYGEISVDLLAEIYEKKYGVHPNTFKGTFCGHIHDYLIDNQYQADIQILTREQITEIEQYVKDKSFFFKQDLLQEVNFSHTLPEYIYKQLGFLSYCSYCVKNTFESVESYFVDKYFSKEQFFIEDTRMYSIGPFRILLMQQKENYQYFEIEKDTYISFEKLNQKYGITKQLMLDYKEAVIHLNKKYFTIAIVNQLLSAHPLLQYQLSNVFFESIIEGSKEFRYQSISNQKVMSKCKDKFYTIDIVSEFTNNALPIHLSDLNLKIKNTVGILLNKERMMLCLRRLNLYFNDDLQTIFTSKKQYFEFITLKNEKVLDNQC